jgi:hypothetical protein
MVDLSKCSIEDLFVTRIGTIVQLKSVDLSQPYPYLIEHITGEFSGNGSSRTENGQVFKNESNEMDIVVRLDTDYFATTNELFIKSITAA